MLKRWMMTGCAALCLTGCGGLNGPDALFKDVAKSPPLTRSEIVEYLITNDRGLAEWIEYQARMCDLHGCAG